MESAPEEHSSDANSLTHSVSNPALHAHEAALIARAGSAPENESVLLGNPEFNIRSDRELDLYNEVGKPPYSHSCRLFLDRLAEIGHAPPPPPSLWVPWTSTVIY